MFQAQYQDTIYQLYKDTPRYQWFYKLIHQLDDTFRGVNITDAAAKQVAYQLILERYETRFVHQSLMDLYTDVLAFSTSNQSRDFPCAPGGIHLYYTDDFVLTLLVSDKMPEEGDAYCSAAHNTSMLCLDGEIAVQRWEYNRTLHNDHWNEQFTNLRLADKGMQRFQSGEVFNTDCRSGFAKINFQSSFVALSMSTRPLLDVQIEFDIGALIPTRMIDTNSDQSNIKMILKILPTLSKNNCNVDEIIALGLTSASHSVRWEAIKAAVLTKASIAEKALFEGLRDSNEDVRISCQRMIDQLSE